MTLKHKFHTHKALPVSADPRRQSFVASTAAPDRHGDIVEQNWDLRDFRKNPVLMFDHAQFSEADGRLPIGSVPKIGVEDGNLVAHTKALPEEMDPFADKIWRFIAGGYLRTVSVGFLPIDQPEPRYSKDGKTFLGFTFPKNSLLELSVTPVPANPEAVALAKSIGFRRQDLERFFVPPGVSAHVREAKRYVEIQRMRVSR